MRFIIKHISSGGERIGNLTEFAKSASTVLDTPTSAIFTQGGSVVHLTAEVLSWVFPNPQLLWVPLSNSYQLEPGLRAQGEGVAKYVGLQQHITCATLQNVNNIVPQGHFNLDKVPLWTRHGKKMISAERYMDLMEVFKPDIFLTIADNRLTLNESSKRINKSVNRTCSMFGKSLNYYKSSKILQNSSLIGVIVGTGNSDELDQCLLYIMKNKHDLHGVALSGMTDGTEESLNVPIHTLNTIFKKVGEALPKEMLKIVEGCWDPAVVVAAIKHGWDLFDGSYPLKLTNAGCALVLNFDTTCQDIRQLCILNLGEQRYKKDFTPILKECTCLACKKHTRAYINHLLNTREMLSSVLLSIHNLHNFNEMFSHARLHIAENTFDAYQRHITNQYELYKTSLVETMTSKVVSVVGFKEANKKLKIDDSNQ